MPSDEMVDRLTLAGFGCLTDNNRSVTARILAALAAAEAGEPVGYAVPQSMERFQEDPTARIFIRVFAAGHLTAHGKDLSEYVPLYTSPPSEASRDERADVDGHAAEMAISSLCGADDGDMSQEWQLSGHQIKNLIVMGIRHATAIRARGET